MEDIAGEVVATPVTADRKPFWRGLRLFAVGCLIVISVLFIVLIAVAIVNVKLVTGSGSTMAITAASLIAYTALILFLLWRLPRLTGQTLAQIGLRAPRLRDIGLLCGAIAIVVCADVVLGLWLEHVHIKHTQAGFEKFHVTGLGAIVFTQFTLSVVTPAAEELLFRGVLFRTLAWRMPVVAAAIISAILFSAIHADLVLFPSLALMGFLAAMLYARTGNLVLAMLLHGLNNLMGLAILIATSHK